jgi:hypothetical protein
MCVLIFAGFGDSVTAIIDGTVTDIGIFNRHPFFLVKLDISLESSVKLYSCCRDRKNFSIIANCITNL